ncbi:MAG TPA: hypothetical protein VFF59_00905 [Anaerolineae bacterium]|nr:hypothetical protein [Anaerolineae bacterium]
MKRITALLISAGITMFLVVTVLAVAQSQAAASTPTAAPAAVAAPAASSDAAVLQQQLDEAYTLMQQREAQYQQQLKDAYAQLQAQGQQAGSGGHESGEHESHGLSHVD